MKSMASLIWISLSCLLIAFAQEGQSPEKTASKPSGDKRVEIQTVLKELSSTYSVKVWFDSSVQGRVLPPQAKSPEEALEEVVSQLPGLVWRKVFLRKELGSEPIPEKVVAAVRALLNVELNGILALDTKTNRLHSFLKDWPVATGFEQTLGSMQPPYQEEGVYVVLNPRFVPAPKAEEQKTNKVDDYVAMQQNMVSMLAQMSPEERERALRDSMMIWWNMDPELRREMMRAGMRMGMEWWQTLSPDQRQRFMQEMAQWWRTFMGGGRRGR